ncbi:MAG: iron-sulfur cluster assembly accessory protein [Candidatus Neomarinimicrobiota bacterium]
MEEMKSGILEGVTLTEQAAQRLLAIKMDKDGDYLRASVTGGGCSGLNYNLDWDTEVGEFDKVFSMHGLDVVVNLKSLLYLKGMEIDFSTDLLSGGFTFNNPNARRTCGCGTSFSV